MHLHLDPLGGIAGDMFAAALLDAFPDAGRELVAALRAAGLAADVDVRWERVDEVLAGTRFMVVDPREAGQLRPPSHAVLRVPHNEAHGHVRYIETRDAIAAARIPPGAVARALDILAHLARAEARVHGIENIDHVTFHEVGAQDSIADIVAAGFLLDAIGASSFSIASLPIGSGRVQTAHGLLPIPAPATTVLLEGFSTHDDGVAGERVTPTGAAIVRHLFPSGPGPSGVSRKPAGTLTHSGTGWGTKRFPGVPNVLRVLALEPTAALPVGASSTVSRIAFEIDDQTSEDLAIGLDHIRAHAGVLDVIQAPAFGKKNRMVASVRVLCTVEAEESVARACLTETTTLGVRVDRVRRVELARESASVGEMHVKSATRPDGTVSTKVESDDVKSIAGHAAREAARGKART